MKIVTPEEESSKSSSHEVSFKISPEEYAAMMAAQTSSASSMSYSSGGTSYSSGGTSYSSGGTSTVTTTTVTKTVSFGGDDVVVIDDR